MNKKIFCGMILLLIVLPIVLAATTRINIKTLPNHDVTIKTLDPSPKEGEKNTLEFFKNSSGSSGEVSITSHAGESTINIIVILEKDGKRVEVNGETVHKFEKKPTGGVIDLEVKEIAVVGEVVEPDEVEEPEAEPETTETEEPETEPEPVEEPIEEVEKEKIGGKITGAIVGGGKAVVTSKITYYIIGGILVIGILFFAVVVGRKKLRSKNFKIIKLGSKREYDRRLEDAENKIEDAKKELDDLKDRRNRLKEAQERFRADQTELRKLERD